MRNDYIKVVWSAPENIQAWQTTRSGGYSVNGFEGLNLATTVGDEPKNVEKNRAQMRNDLVLPGEPEWIRLVHGNRVLDVAQKKKGLEEADATYTNQLNRVLLIPTADCLPVLFASRNGDEVAASHAGWRGLSAGVLEKTINQFRCSAADLIAWLGPAIGPQRFEVGQDVYDAFTLSHPGSNCAFTKTAHKGKYLADLYKLARHTLIKAGVSDIYGGGFCTFDDKRFFSYRRQGRLSGRMASLIWISKPSA